MPSSDVEITIDIYDSRLGGFSGSAQGETKTEKEKTSNDIVLNIGGNKSVSLQISTEAAKGTSFAVTPVAKADLTLMNKAVADIVSTGGGNFSAIPLISFDLGGKTADGKKSELTDVAISVPLDDGMWLAALEDFAVENGLSYDFSKTSAEDLFELSQLAVAHRNSDGTVDTGFAPINENPKYNTMDTSGTMSITASIYDALNALIMAVNSDTASPFALYLIIDENALAELIADEEQQSDTDNAEAPTDNDSANTTPKPADNDSANTTDTTDNDTADDTNPPTGVGLALGTVIATGAAAFITRGRKRR